MKNSFKHFIKHLEYKLYINPKTHNYNINMQQLSNISDLHVTLYDFLAKKSKQLSTISHLHVTLYHFLLKKSKF